MNIEKEKTSEFKDLILTSEEYKNTPFACSHDERSYVFELKNNGKEIVYFGSSHTNNPADPLFKEIKEKFEETKPDIVYIEGWENLDNMKDEVRDEMREKSLEDIKLEGESHYTLKLAIDAGIDFESPEPTLSSEIVYLLDNGFSKKDIFGYYSYRDIAQYQRMNKERSTEVCIRYLEPYFKRFRQDSGWEPSELNILEQEIISELDINDPRKYSDQVDPIPWEGKEQTIFNEIARNSNNFRDRYIFEKITEGLKTHNKIFIVYGSAHAVVQEPALRALLS